MSVKNSTEVSRRRSSPYELHVMRHGIAVSRGATGVLNDSKRPLTPQGKSKVRQIAAGLSRLGVEFDWIVTSPFVRAVETAEIVADSSTVSVPVDFCEALTPGGTVEELIRFLAQHPERKRVLVVGHEPDLSQMAGRLIGAGRAAKLALKKGGCCLIAFDEFPPRSPGELVWWLPPRVLRRLA